MNDRNVNRKCGYAFRGKRAAIKQSYSRGNRYTVTAAFDLDSIVDYTILSMCIM